MQEAIVKYIDDRRKKWVCCPQCGRKQFPVDEGTEIKNLTFQCKDTRCKYIFKVNY